MTHPAGVILTTDELDHEAMAGYVLIVRAQDHGDPPLSNTAYVQINVTDINDSPPVFAQSVYSAKIREDVPVGSKVIQVCIFLRISFIEVVLALCQHIFHNLSASYEGH